MVKLIGHPQNFCHYSHVHSIIFSLASVHCSFNVDYYYFHWIYCCNGVAFICKRMGAQTAHLFNVRIVCTIKFLPDFALYFTADHQL